MQCRCAGNIICSNHWTKEHTKLFIKQQKNRKWR